jgi:thiol-disulfide isomerase/thioredoxin
MRAAFVLTAICLLAVPLARTVGLDANERRAAADDVSTDHDQPRFAWYGDDGTERWSAALARASGAGSVVDSRGEPLHARPWYPLLPAAEVGLMDGETVRLDAYSGQVLVLSFWATWCAPCRDELPWLQRFYEAERDRGLAVLTVNMQEPDDVALRFARELDLRLPIARYGGPLEDALRVRSLPTVIVVDRERRIRARFDANTGGVERRIADLTRGLLEETPEQGPEIARVLLGGGGLVVHWSRTAVATVRGLAVLAAAEPGERQVVAATGWEVVGYDAQGKVLGTRRAGPGVDRLTLGRVEQGPPPMLGFRPASDRVVPIEFDGESGPAWRAPAPVFDLRIVPAPGGAAPTALLATLVGLHRVGLDGGPVASRDDLGLVVQVGEVSGRTIALGGDGRLSWLDGDLSTIREMQVRPGSRLLVTLPDEAEGFGVGPASVEVAAVGQLLTGGGAHVALATAGQLVVFDLSSGRERFRADWPQIAALAAGDLDGDGRDELFVGSGGRVTALQATSEPDHRAIEESQN